jgi:hypothetical protein
MKKIFSIELALIAALIIGFFFTYRITKTPPGLTIDEAAFGYNAVLLGKTGHDQNGRFMPVFVLSISGADWRQPVPQYYMAAFLKIFGSSIFTLRLSTVGILLISVFLLYFWLSKIIDRRAGIIGSLIFLTTPIIMIQTHMALDNIYPIPFTLAWLICLCFFTDTKKLKYLIFAGISLGICFYTYKAMRATVPVWCILTIIYLFFDQKKHFFKNALYFTLGVLPFFAVIPLLEQKYAGAVFNSQGFNWSSIYNFLYPYFSSFDPSFLFIKGDETIWHSTGIHGMLLLSSLPLFLVGLYNGVKRRGIWIFIIAMLFTTPLLYGFVGSVHRASRLMAFIPAFVALTTLGVITILELKNKILSRFLLITISILFVFNYLDFVNYYWYTYPKFAESSFRPANTIEDAYAFLSKVAKKNNLTAYVQSNVRKADGDTGNFLEAAYFKTPLKFWGPEQPLPPRSILMAKLGHQSGLVQIVSPISDYSFFTNQGEAIMGL